VQVHSGPEKNAQSLLTVILKLSAVESRSFYQNAQKLTADTKRWQMFNIVIKYSLFGSWQGNYFKSINTGNIFNAVITEKKFAKSNRYKINVKHFHPKN